MTRPQKHRKTGIFWFRTRVPRDVQARVGKGEITRTLDTRDPVEAEERHRRIAEEIAARWAELRGEGRALTPMQRVALAGEMYREMIAAGEARPGDANAIEALIAADRQALRRIADRRNPAALRRRGLDFYVRYNIRLTEFLARRDGRLPHREQVSLLPAFVEAVVQANEQLLRNARGDYGPDPKAARFPEYVSPEKERVLSTSLADLYDLYVGHLKHQDGTIKRWRPMYARFEQFIAPKPWHKATKQDALDWLDELLKPTKFKDRKPVQAVTIQDVHFPALRALYGFLAERDWCQNPFKGVRVRVPKNREEVREKDLTEDEAKTILRASLEPRRRMSPEYQAAFRWIPWILAYTGARVNEITQMRKGDVKRGNGIDVFNITPEAGGTKTRKARLVPVHPHLIEMGLLEFVRASAKGPLFYSTARTRGGKNAAAPYRKTGERLAAWVRSLGVDDAGVQPNHGWRHRLTSIFIDLEMPQRIIDAILGHKKGAYGNVRLETKKRAIDRIPRIVLDESSRT